MKFIPKKKVLNEAEVNPLETNSVDLSYDEQYKQAIIKAVASESGAIVEYDQILSIEPHVTTKSLVDLFHDMLIDIKNEEIKHLAQLNTGLSQVDTIKDAYADGEEEAEIGEDNSETSKEVKESSELTESTIQEEVEKDRMYDSYEIAQIIAQRYEMTTEQYNEMLKLLDPNDKKELTSEEVDTGMLKLAELYAFDINEIAEIEQAIADSPNPVINKEFNNDISYDINTLEDMLNSFSTHAAYNGVKQLIDELKKMDYNTEN